MALDQHCLTSELNSAPFPRHRTMVLYQHCPTSLANQDARASVPAMVGRATLICALLIARAKLTGGKVIEFLVGKLRFGQDPRRPVCEKTWHLNLTIAAFAKQLGVRHHASWHALEYESLSQNLG
jgi:hypothetical protein